MKTESVRLFHLKWRGQPFGSPLASRLAFPLGYDGKPFDKLGFNSNKSIFESRTCYACQKLD
jgi:hypothetical protein